MTSSKKTVLFDLQATDSSEYLILFCLVNEELPVYILSWCFVTEANTSRVRSPSIKGPVPTLYNIKTLEKSAEFENKRNLLTNILILPILSQAFVPKTI